MHPAETRNFKNRIGVLMACCILAAGAITARAAYIQFWANPRLEQMSRKQFQSKVLIRPRRGIIADRSGEPLAVNLETNSLAANPLKIENRRTLVRLLTKAMDLPPAVIAKRLSEKKEFVWIKRHLSEAELARLKRFRVIDTDGDLLTGLWMVKESQRVYPHGELAAHTLGDVNIDSEGVEGVDHLAGGVAGVVVAGERVEGGLRVSKLAGGITAEIEVGGARAVEALGGKL